ncbi:hypothetical protein BV22DRAFT_1051648 [Leucogyrophana mollusca]|uniref:Uncharacterized protein n=1 Tax=Leucogyrophana mollusca TaxID=85980 RepID=A0ACB8AYF6_9AGAM|nr:hypothetical protein BV22DRAFT_1051648 [Leucogyrophana mollusca]
MPHAPNFASAGDLSIGVEVEQAGSRSIPRTRMRQATPSSSAQGTSQHGALSDLLTFPHLRSHGWNLRIPPHRCTINISRVIRATSLRPDCGRPIWTGYDILKEIAKWLEMTYRQRITFSSILFFHSISENRMRGAPLRNPDMFEELCGMNALQNVVLTTTMAPGRGLGTNAIAWVPYRSFRIHLVGLGHHQQVRHRDSKARPAAGPVGR